MGSGKWIPDLFLTAARDYDPSAGLVALMGRIKTRLKNHPSLRELDLGKLSQGSAVPASILTADGHVILHAGQTLDAARKKALRRHGADGIFGGNDWPEDYFLRVRKTPNKRDSSSQPRS